MSEISADSNRSLSLMADSEDDRKSESGELEESGIEESGDEVEELEESGVEESEEEEKKSKKKKQSKKLKSIIENFDVIDRKYLETKFNVPSDYDVKTQQDIVKTLTKFRIFEKDVAKYWRIKCNQIKMAIYRGYIIPTNELQLLEKSTEINPNGNEAKNLIYFYAYIAHRWEHVKYNLEGVADAGSFKILFYQTYLTALYFPVKEPSDIYVSETYKPKVQTFPKTPLYIYYTYTFTQDYISNLALSLQYHTNIYPKFSCCIISDLKPKKNDVVKINDYKTIIEDSKFSSETSLLFSFMNMSEFILDVFSHMLNPKIQMIDSDTKKDLFERETSSGQVLKRYTSDQLPQILRTDIVSKYLNMKIGNIIMIDNVNLVFESITPASRTVRVCTNTDIIKKSK
jgi:DNA-directed RNA polymerase subunit H (RpoH/RPB5)